MRFVITEEEKKQIRKLYEDFSFKEIMLGEKLNEKFVKLGDLTNLSYDEIVKGVRRPDSIYLRDNFIIATWNTSKTDGVLFPNPYYSITILFDPDRKFVKIIDQSFS